MEPMTPTALKKLRVVDLKEKLSALGLPLNGLKADLIKRLLDFYSSQARIREEATFNVVQQPPPQTLPTVQPSIGQAGLVHGGSSYYINQNQPHHQLQLGGHIQHTSPSPSISIQPCFAPTPMPHDELPLNYSSQVNTLSSPLELSTHHTHQSHQSHSPHHPSHQPHPLLQSPHQSHHQTHQAHQAHQAHQTHQPHQAHQSHQIHHTHQFHSPPHRMHVTPSVIESSHLKMPSDESAHYFGNIPHNQSIIGQSMAQPLQSSSIDLSSNLPFNQEKSNIRECQSLEQSQAEVAVATSHMKQSLGSNSPAVSMEQPQDPMIHEEPDDNQGHETPQKAIFDLENLLNEALKANQGVDSSSIDLSKDYENVPEPEQTSSQTEDSCSVTDLSQKPHEETSSILESVQTTETPVHPEPETICQPKEEPEPHSQPQPAYQPEPEPEPEMKSETSSVQETERELDSHYIRETEQQSEFTPQPEKVEPEPCLDFSAKPVEADSPTMEPIDQLKMEDQREEIESENEPVSNFDEPQRPPTFASEETDQQVETERETERETEMEPSVETRNSEIFKEVEAQIQEEEEDNRMEMSFEKEEESSNVQEEKPSQIEESTSNTIEAGADAQQSVISELKASDDGEDLALRTESSVTNIDSVQPEPSVDFESNVINHSNQLDFSCTSESNEYPSSESNLEQPVDQQISRENEVKNDMNVSVIIDPKRIPVIPPPVKVTQSTDRSETESKQKLSKNAKKKLRKKKKKAEKALASSTNENEKSVDVDEDDIEIEYVEDEVVRDPIYFQYVKVFEKFKTGDSKGIETSEDESGTIDPAKKMLERKKPVELELKEEDDKNDGEPKLSKRKLKQLTRMTVADLKQKVSHPELVEMHDVTAKDPILLLHLKSTRNSVPVPRHWCYKRKYLQGKRGFEKPPFKLPEFIRKTGIMEMRQALAEKEDAKSLKTKQREKIRPKLGKIDIDYQKLHDAFFKWQTKPRMTIHGDIYYEGKEFETRLKEKKPGDLSVDLRVALGMPTGPNAHKCPPPWLIAMQRYGPPPSYPNLKIPGLNSRIPDGCTFGYHAGGWGKPPVDEYGRPLYGDVFGLSSAQDSTNAEEEVDKSFWGEMESEEEEEEEEEEEDEDDGDRGDKPSGREGDTSGIETPSEGLATPSGFASIPNGMETPDIIELRKRKIEAEMESNENPALFTVIPEKKTDRIGKEMMGSAHVYDISGPLLKKGQGIDVTLNPEELELPAAGLAARYEQTYKEQQQAHLAKEDLSDMVAEHVARQKRKKTQDTSKSNKKYKDFKF